MYEYIYSRVQWVRVHYEYMKKCTQVHEYVSTMYSDPNPGETMVAQHRSACCPLRFFKHKSVPTSIKLPQHCVFLAMYRQSVGNERLQILCYLYQYYHFLNDFVQWIYLCIWLQMRIYSSLSIDGSFQL